MKATDKIRGAGGVSIPATEALAGLSQPVRSVPVGGRKPCPNKHWIAVRLSDKSTGKEVSAARCEIAQGGAVQVPGPLAIGRLDGYDLDAGSYQVSFPDIDASEWEPAT